jgi:hypothetical protein
MTQDLGRGSQRHTSSTLQAAGRETRREARERERLRRRAHETVQWSIEVCERARLIVARCRARRSSDEAGCVGNE